MPDLLSDSVVQDILARRAYYKNAGLAMVAVAAPNSITGRTEWSQEIVTDGIANKDGRPYQEDTIFDIASCSKAFAFLCVGLLIDRGTTVPSTGDKLSWNTRIKDVLGYLWELQDSIATEHATLMDIAGMRTGSPAHVFAIRTEYPDQAIFRRRYLKQSVGFRERFQYSQDPQVLCLVVEILSKQTYPEFLSTNVLIPLQLDSTGHGITRFKGSERLCDGFIRTNVDVTKPGPKGWGEARPIGWTLAAGDWLQGTAGLSTDIRDAAKILREYLHPTLTPDNIVQGRRRPVSHLTPPDFPSSYFFAPGCHSAGYGYGAFQFVYRGFECLLYPGLGFGQTSIACVLPDAGIGCWVASNDESPGSQINNDVVTAVFDDLLGLESLAKPLGTDEGNSKSIPTRVPEDQHTLESDIAVSSTDAVLLDQQGFFDPGYGLWTFSTFDMLDQGSDLIAAIQEGARASPSSSQLGAWIVPSSRHRYYVADINARFATKIMLVSTSRPTVYQVVAIKIWPFTDGKGGYGIRFIGPSQLIVTHRGIGVFGFIDRTNLSGKDVFKEWDRTKDWRLVQSEAEVWFHRISVATQDQRVSDGEGFSSSDS